MKKIFFLLACIGLVCTVFILSCSDDKELKSSDVTTKSLSTDKVDMKGEVPRDRLLYRTIGHVENLSTNDIVDAYKKDISTAQSDYLTNLKNMWLTALNNRVYEDGTEDQKLFFINEQLALENNLAHFTGFYNLLATSKKLTKDEKVSMADAYYDKNLKQLQMSNGQMQ